MIDNDANTAPPPLSEPARLGRLGALLAVVNAGWALPSAAGGTLLQALMAQQRGADKVGSLALVTTVGAVIAVVTTVVAGALSDRTRSRFGKRNPWILGGAVASATGLTLTGLLPWLPAQIVTVALFQAGLSAMLAAVNALLPDRVAESALGRASAYSGLGYLVGTAVGGVVASAAIGFPALGLVIVPWTMVAAALLLVLLVHGRSSLADPRPPLSVRALARSLLPPKDRDFLLAFVGRFCTILGLTVIAFYQLYIYTDFLHVDTATAAADIAAGTVLLGATALIGTVSGGLLSDRLRRRRPLVVLASALIAAAALPVTLTPSVPALTVFYIVAGLGYGLYLSVDQALMVEVLPDTTAAAKQLGMLSVANSAPSVIAPAIAAVVVTLLGFHALFLFTVVIAVLGGGCVAAIRRVR